MSNNEKTVETDDICPKCGSTLGEEVTTKSGRKLKRCSNGKWNEETRKNEGCDYVKWLPFEPQNLDEKCPKCGSNLVLTMTRFNKKMKKCSTATWDPNTKTAGGCDYIEWVKGTIEQLDEKCPKCGNNLVIYTSSSGKRMKKCSTNSWDPQTRSATGCDFIEWLK
jgi:ssDNA-binding Zn-finger/Zn-ribbon topoisomerase 1